MIISGNYISYVITENKAFYKISNSVFNNFLTCCSTQISFYIDKYQNLIYYLI